MDLSISLLSLLNSQLADSKDISQYQEVIIRVQLVGLSEEANKAVRLNISSPSYADGITEVTPDDFEYNVHLIPIVGQDLFEVRLNEILGNSLKIGELNVCPVMFTATDGNSEWNSNIQSIDLYKTNLDVEYVPNDLSSIFITLADISKRLNALEG